MKVKCRYDLRQKMAGPVYGLALLAFCLLMRHHLIPHKHHHRHQKQVHQGHAKDHEHALQHGKIDHDYTIAHPLNLSPRPTGLFIPPNNYLPEMVMVALKVKQPLWPDDPDPPDRSHDHDPLRGPPSIKYL